MNFSDESDVWDSTPTQDVFIQKYFGKNESSNKVISKRARKRKKHQASNATSTSIQSATVKNKTLITSRLNNLNDYSKDLNMPEKSLNKDSLTDYSSSKTINHNKLKVEGKKQINKYLAFGNKDKNNMHSINSIKVENKDIKDKQQKPKKRKITSNIMSKNCKNVTELQESSDLESDLPSKTFRNQKKLKTKTIVKRNVSSDSEGEGIQAIPQKPKKKKAKTSELSNIKKKSLLHETKVQTKKVKAAKNIPNAKDSSQDESDNSEEDNDIRNELQNSKMFLKIQKLMKLAPHLNPNHIKGSEGKDRNTSCDEISSEYSSEELDGEYSSDEENEDLVEEEFEDVVEDDKEESKDQLEDDEEELGDLVESDEEESEDQVEDDDEELEDQVEDDDEELEELSEGSMSGMEEGLSDSNGSSDDEDRNIECPKSTKKTSKQVTPDAYINTPAPKKPNTFMEKARSKLAAAKFRFLNEKLYTETGGEAFRYFQENNEEFEDYHLGYRQQVAKWPLNPVDEILADLQKLKKDKVIADLGCGEAKISRVLTNRTVHSFDLVAKHKCVTACDFSKVPLKDGSVDVAVFCLSLMGVNLVDYLREAYRILKMGGTLKIAEVESRIEDLGVFIENLKTLGFDLERKNTKNKLFVFLDLKKVKKKKASKAANITLRPCMYKKR